MIVYSIKKKLGSQRGSAAVLSLILILLLGSLGSILLMSSTTELKIAINERDGITAQYLAEAGIQWTIVKLKTNPTFVEETKAEKYVTHKSFSELTPTPGNYTIEVTPGSPIPNGQIRYIRAIGAVNQAKRQVFAQITLPQTESKTRPLQVIWNY